MIAGLRVPARFCVRVLAKAISCIGKLRVGNFHEELALLTAALKQEQMPKQQAEPREPIHLLIVIPFRDKWDLTEKCLLSLRMQIIEKYFRISLALVDNGSREPETLKGLSQFRSLNQDGPFEGIQCIRIDEPFNFSALNNIAVQNTSEEITHCLFLNNDVEFTAPDQLNSWLNWVSDKQNVGLTGCTLLYPNRTIQHACVLPGFKIVATHPLRNASESVAIEWTSKARSVPAVTAAAMLTRKDVFLNLGGFDEKLAHAIQDVDLCLKALKAGYSIWTVPNVILIHHESASRTKSQRLFEVEYFQEKWGQSIEVLTQVSPKISRWLEEIRPSWGEGAFPWRLFTHDMELNSKESK